jgi:hypothetical protein
VREKIAYLHQLAETVKADCQKEFAAKRLDPKTEEASNYEENFANLFGYSFDL